MHSVRGTGVRTQKSVGGVRTGRFSRGSQGDERNDLRPDLGFKFLGLGSKIECLGFRVQGLGFRVLGLGFRISG